MPKIDTILTKIREICPSLPDTQRDTHMAAPALSMDATQIRRWEEVRILIHESYRLIAPKKRGETV